MSTKKKKLKFPDDFINKIICGDSLSVMKQMPDECIDIAVTSPPYNLKNPALSVVYNYAVIFTNVIHVYV